MTEFYDIFSRKKEIIKIDKPIETKEIIKIDYREQNSFVPTNLKKLGYEIEFLELKVADYIVKDVAIERKTVSDFLSSMIDKRLAHQLEELQQYQNKLLIIEGIEEQELYNDDNLKGINANAIRGFLLSILLKHNVPIIFSKNQKDTAKFIDILAKRQSKEVSLNAKKRTLKPNEQLQFITESFPGIGPKTAKKLLIKFRTIRKIINASHNELKKIIGKQATIIKSIIDQQYIIHKEQN